MKEGGTRQQRAKQSATVQVPRMAAFRGQAVGACFVQSSLAQKAGRLCTNGAVRPGPYAAICGDVRGYALAHANPLQEPSDARLAPRRK